MLTLKYAKEKDMFEKNMTLKREKKKDSVTKKLLEQERAAAAALIEKQSDEMMNLIAKEKAKIVENGVDFEDDTSYPTQPPPPHPPNFNKIDIYKVRFINSIRLKSKQHTAKTLSLLLKIDRTLYVISN